MSDSRVTLPVATIAQAIRLRYPLYSAVSDEHLIDIFAGENPQCRLVREGGKVSLENLSSIFSQDANSQAEGVTPRSEPVPTSEADKPLAESQERTLRVPKRVIAGLVWLTAITLLAAMALIVYSKHRISTRWQTALDQALSPAPVTTPPVREPQFAKPALTDVPNGDEVSPDLRRLLIAAFAMNIDTAQGNEYMKKAATLVRTKKDRNVYNVFYQLHLRTNDLFDQLQKLRVTCTVHTVNKIIREDRERDARGEVLGKKESDEYVQKNLADTEACSAGDGMTREAKDDMIRRMHDAGEAVNSAFKEIGIENRNWPN